MYVQLSTYVSIEAGRTPSPKPQRPAEIDPSGVRYVCRVLGLLGRRRKTETSPAAHLSYAQIANRRAHRDARRLLYSIARHREWMSKSPSPSNVTSIDCPHCGSKGYVLQATSADKKDEVRIYLCGDCGKRTEIVVID